MKFSWKNLFLLVGIVILDFALILLMRQITPANFLLRLSIIAVIALGSIVIYYFIVKPANWLKESLFVAVVMTVLALILTLVLHQLIEHNLSVKNFLVSGIAFVTPFICGGIYRLIGGKNGK